VRCIEAGAAGTLGLRVPARLSFKGLALALCASATLVAGCAAPGPVPEVSREAPREAPQAVQPAAAPGLPPTPAAAVPAAPAAQSRPAQLPLPQARAARSWEEFQHQAAQRLVAASPGRSYLTAVPDVLLAIPVLEVELTAEGQVRRIKVLRMPTQATDTVQLAKDAVYRAAPYGAMRHLDKPWTFVEVFLFDDERRFKPRTLDH